MKKRIKKLASVLTLLLAAFPFSVQAFFIKDVFDELDEIMQGDVSGSQVINKIEVSSEAGETVINNKVKQGQATSKIKIHNIVNGEEIDPVEIETESGKIVIEQNIESKDGKTVVQRETQIDEEKETEEFEVNLEESKSEGHQSMREGWWQTFINNFNKFLASLFNIF
ncbi:MAG: hypothetical protein GF370_00995 [Candidatus Nealsonbacteria bacterium]|nr:hypothetical protein [Candidatus Nealsonbacteria bacterium]